MRRTAIALVAVAALLAAAAPAAGRDPDAPPGASHRWLPCEDWVMYHWLPFEEVRLLRELRLRPAQLRDWLRDDRRHDIAQLARRRGMSPAELADRLVAPWSGRVTAEWHAELRERALRTVRNGHLAQHLLYHRFHHPAVALNARSIFGVRALEYRRLRLTGRSPAEIARARGRSRRTVARRAMRVLRRSQRLGVRIAATPPRQARRFVRAQGRGVSWWLDAKISKPGARRTHPIYRKRTLRPRRHLLCFLFAGRPDLEH